MIELYRRLADGCRSINQLNAVRIALENRMTPREVHELWARLPVEAPLLVRGRRLFRALRRKLGLNVEASVATAKARDAERRWVEKLRSRMMLSGKPTPEPFARKRLASGMVLYSNGGDPSGKVLILAFTGSAHRMMMPLPVFLQHLDARTIDIVMLYDRSRCGYRNGIGNVARTLDELADCLHGLVPGFARYRRRTCIGISGGGLPAVLVALKLNLGPVISVGGNNPDDPRWLDARDAAFADEIARHGAGRDSVDTVLMFGDGHTRDRESAERLAELLPATLVEVSDPSGPVGHNSIYPFVGQKKLAPFLAEHLRLDA